MGRILFQERGMGARLGSVQNTGRKKGIILRREQKKKKNPPLTKMPHHVRTERDHVRLRDANLYCEIRDRLKTHDQDGVTTARNKLSSNHARRCTALLNDSKHSLLSQHLDDILGIIAMRSSFLLKVMHKVLAVRCPEVSQTPVKPRVLDMTLTIGNHIIFSIYS